MICLDSVVSDADINVPLVIEGQLFVLEINDIRNIEIIDLDESKPSKN
jgi:hypothetical protein